jgi:hypothetical protein
MKGGGLAMSNAHGETSCSLHSPGLQESGPHTTSLHACRLSDPYPIAVVIIILVSGGCFYESGEGNRELGV